MGRSIEDAPFGRFQRRLTIYSCGGPFCDGYILGIVAIALPQLSKDIGLDESWQGLIAAAALIGMFVGGVVFGYLTDLLGRRVMYTLDLVVLIAASAAQFWVSGPWSLFVLRFVLGVAIGADYPIAAALLAEFAPRKQRGMLMASLIGAWWVGYTVSFIAGFVFSNQGAPTWRWMLASSAIPALVVSLLRFGTPESPRWLLSKGRRTEARRVVDEHFGPDYLLDEAPPVASRFRAIFQGEYLWRTLFICIFWSCQVVPAFAIYTFAPDLLRAFGSPNPTLGAAIVSLFFLAGVVPAVLLIDRVGRRPLLIVPFVVTGLTLLTLAMTPKGYGVVVVSAFVVFAMFNAGGSVLQWAYPSELFPTEVRATALGFATSVSRIGGAIGTFLFPIGLAQLGVSNILLMVAGVCAIGAFVSWKYAPETRGLALGEASGLLHAERSGLD